MPYKTAALQTYHNRYNKAYYDTHKEEESARRRAYYANHKEEQLASRKRYYQEHIETQKAKAKEYRDAHKTELAIADRIDYTTKTIEIVCVWCGNTANVNVTLSGKFCSQLCSNKWHSGQRSPVWQGGTSFEPYCPKFNDDLRSRIRTFFDHRCMLCGKSTEENKRNLGCHHVEYNKLACCDGKPIHFTTLCNSCHAKTNRNRPRWEAMLHRIIDEIYDGRSYYTKEEYIKMRGDA